MIFFAKLSEKEFVGEFIDGASDLLGVVIIIVLDLGVIIIMENGMINDISGAVSNMNGVIFSKFILFVYIILGFFISSSSGLAFLSMLIMAPLEMLLE